jgi:hypothetical protein
MSTKWACALAFLCLAPGQATGAMIRGVVTGDIGHLPWRKGKRELGWCAVQVRRDGILWHTTRTNAGTGDFEMTGLPSGPLELEVSPPGFVTDLRDLEATGREPGPLRIHLSRDPHFGLIVLPRTGTAITSTPGEPFVIECLAPSHARNWSASLFAEHFSRPLVVAEAKFGERAVWNGTRPGWRVGVRAPSKTPSEMYHLRVAFRDAQGKGHMAEQAKAVCIRSSYPDAFRLMPYTDFHLDWHVNKPGAAGGVQADFFKAASLLNPLFVSLGDDVGFETDDAVAMSHYLVTNYSDVPVSLAFGNHDAGIGIEGYEFYFGPRWQTRRIGPHIGLILSYDLYQANYAIPDDQRKWVNAALQRFHADPNNRLIFLAGHLNTWKPPTPFFELPFTKETRTWFPGHTDGGRTVEFERLFMHSLSVGSMHGWAGLNYTGRVMEFEGWKRATLLPQCALPTVTFDKPNNGTATTLTATIRLTGLPEEKWTPPEGLYTGGYFCDLPKEWKGLPKIRDARLRFVMPKGRYRCSAGRIIQAVDGDSGKTTLVYVSVDVKEPEVKVAVSPDSSR